MVVERLMGHEEGGDQCHLFRGQKCEVWQGVSKRKVLVQQRCSHKWGLSSIILIDSRSFFSRSSSRHRMHRS